MKSRVVIVSILALVILGMSAPVLALDKIVFGTPMPSGKVMPLIIAKETGMFEKYGLNVELQYFNSGTMATTSLAAGQTALSCSGGSDAILAMVGGADFVIISGISNTLDSQLLSAKAITNPEQLKGKAVGISAFGSISELEMKTALRKLGLVPEKDVTLLQVGAPTQRIAALQSGNIQATSVSPPGDLIARKMGMNVLLDMLDLKIEAAGIVIVTTRALAEKNPDLVERCMKGMVAGIQYMRTHKTETIEMMKKAMQVDDMEALEGTYQQVLLKGIPIKPYPTVKGIQFILDWVAERNPNAKNFKAEKMADSRFISKLDSSGFIDSLYKK